MIYAIIYTTYIFYYYYHDCIINYYYLHFLLLHALEGSVAFLFYCANRFEMLWFSALKVKVDWLGWLPETVFCCHLFCYINPPQPFLPFKQAIRRWLCIVSAPFLSRSCRAELDEGTCGVHFKQQWASEQRAELTPFLLSLHHPVCLMNMSHCALVLARPPLAFHFLLLISPISLPVFPPVSRPFHLLPPSPPRSPQLINPPPHSCCCQ